MDYPSLYKHKKIWSEKHFNLQPINKHISFTLNTNVFEIALIFTSELNSGDINQWIFSQLTPLFCQQTWTQTKKTLTAARHNRLSATLTGPNFYTDSEKDAKNLGKMHFLKHHKNMKDSKLPLKNKWLHIWQSKDLV